VRLSATVDDPLLRARTELLAAGIRLTYDTWRACIFSFEVSSFSV